MVLVHGLGVSAALYTHVAAQLRHHARVVALDLPGFAGLPDPGDPMTIAQFARAADRALDHLGVSDPVLVGHSMGAQVVVEMVRRRPELSDRLVLIGPVVWPEQSTFGAVARAFLRSSVHERPGAALVSVKDYVFGGLRWPLETLPAMLSYPIAERLAGFAGRLEIIRGEGDRLCPPQWADELVAATKGSGTVHVARGAAHQVVVDNADEVVEVVLGLLREPASRAGGGD